MQEPTRGGPEAGRWQTVRQRAIVLTVLIVVLPLLWLLFGLQLPLVAQLALALLGVGVLAVATAWTVSAVPPRSGGRA